MRSVYVAHPVSGDVAANVARARRWLRWLYLSDPSDAFVADWILRAEELGPESDEGVWDFCLELLSRCNAIVLVGGRLTDGMLRERTCAIHHGLDVYDLTWLGEEPPQDALPPIRRCRCGAIDWTVCGNGGAR